MTDKKEKRRKKLIVEHRDGYVLIYPAGRKPPRVSKSPLKPIDYFVGATLENGELVNSKREVKKHGKNKRKTA